MRRHVLPDGKVLLVHGKWDDGSWELELADQPEAQIVGKPLASTLAELLGYQVAHEEWPEWIDQLAAQIERGDT